MVEAGGHRDVLDQLVLHRNGFLPVRRSRQVCIELRGARRQAEVIVARHADFRGLDVAVRVEDGAVPVEVAPRAGIGLTRQRVGRRRKAERLLREEFADRHLEGRAAVAEDVVRRAEPDGPVVPARQARDGRDIRARRFRGRRHEQALLRRAVGDGQARQRPFVLRVDPEVRVQVLELVERRIRQRHGARRRHAVDVDVGERGRVSVALHLRPLVAPLLIQPGLEVVRSGHV